MARSVILSLLVLALSSVSSENYHQNKICTHEGLQPDPKNCRAFFWCNLSENGILQPLKIECDRGMIYDTSTQSCMHPMLSTREECKDEFVSNEVDSGRMNEIPYPLKQNDNDCSQEGFMADDENCQKFYRCVGDGKGNYMKYEFSCGDGTVWDPDISGCNHAWAVKNEKCRTGTNSENNQNNNGYPETSTLSGSSGQNNYNPNLGYPGSEGIYGQNNYDNPNSGYPQNPPPGQGMHGQYPTQGQGIYGQNPNQGQGMYGQYPTQGQGMYGQNPTQGQGYPSQEQGQNNYDPNYGTQTNPPIKPTTTSPVSQSTQSPNLSSTTEPTQTSTEASKNTENESNACQYEGFLADYKDCKKFYRCVAHAKGFTKYEFSCSQGTIWDPEINNCNYPASVKSRNCTGSTDQETAPNTTDNSEATSSIQPESQSSSTEQTTIVTQGSTESSNNPSSSETSSTTQSITESSILPGNTELAQNTTPSNSRDACIKEGFLGDSNDCKKFYRCVNNDKGGFIKYEFTCGEGTVWDSEIENCNYPWATKGKCGNGEPIVSSTTTVSNEIVSASTSTESSYSEPVTKVEENSTNKPSSTTETNESNASTSTESNYSEPVTKVEENPTNKPSSTTETNESNATTESNEISSESNPTPVDTSGNKQDCKGEDFLSDPNDCKKFYRCVNDGRGGFIKYEFSCGEGTVWDGDSNTCNHPSATKSSCGTGEKEESINTESSGNQITTLSGTESSSSMEITSESSTSQNTNPSISTTETSHITTDQGSSTTEKSSTESSASNELTTSSGGLQNAEDTCTQNGFIGDSKDCKKFYRCVDNEKGGFTKYEFSCGEGTVWDGEQSTCNYPWAVKGKCNQLGSNEVETGNENQGTTDSGTNTSNSQTTEAIASSSGQPDSGTSTVIPDTSQSTTELGPTITPQPSQSTSKPETSQPTNQPDQTSSTSTTEEPSSSESSEKQPESSNTESTPAPDSSQNAEDTCTQDGFIGDSKDCKKFYRCVNNGKGGFTKYEFSCGEGTVWDGEQSTCNYPWAVKGKCNSLSSETETGIENQGTTESGKNTTDSQITEVTQSSSSQSSSEPDSGSTNVKPDTNQSTTEFGSTITPEPDQTSSSTESSSESTTISVTSKPGNGTQSLDQDCKQEGFLGDSNDCKKFYRCVDNGKGSFTKYEFSCGEGTVWDSELVTCNYPSAVKSQNCGDGSEASTETSSSQVTEVQTEQSITTGLNQITNAPVTEGKTDSPDIQTSSTEQVSTVSQEQTTSSTSQEQTTLSTQTEPTTTISQEQTTVGSQTEHSTTQEQTISSQTEQSTTLSQEQTTGSTQTEQSSTITSTQEQSSSSPTTTTAKPTSSPTASQQNTCTKEGFIPNTQDCKKFIRCVSNGKGGYTKYDFNCGEGTIWDPDLDTCNYPYAVQNKKCEQSGQSTQKPSGESSTQGPEEQSTTTATQSTTGSQQPGEQSSTKGPHIPDESTTVTQKPEQSTTSQTTASSQKDTCTGEGFFPSSQDCKKFYRCVGNGKGSYSKYDFTCGEGTIWDPSLDTCNYPSAADNKVCMGGQTSEATTEKAPITDSPSETTTHSSETTTESSETTTESSATTTESSETTTESSATTTESSETTTVTSETTTVTSETTTQSSETTTESSETTTQHAETTTQSSETTTEELSTTTGGETTEVIDTTTHTQTTEISETTSQSPETTTNQITTEEATTITEPAQTTTESSSESTDTTQQQTTTEAEITSTDSTITTESITTETSETTTDSTTEAQTTSVTTESQTTELPTEESTLGTTDSSQTDGTTDASVTTELQTEGTTDENATTGTTVETTDSNESTTENAVTTAPCPISQLDGDQVSLVCPTGFKRHPKYCNLFYQCTTNPNSYDIKILVLSCPNGTIYDDTKIQCLPPGETEQRCSGEIAEQKTYKRSSTELSPMIIEIEKPLCPSEGSFALQPNECDPNFIKCQQSETRKMRGFVYQCPENYTYWPISRKCEPHSAALQCGTQKFHKTKWHIPTETMNLSRHTAIVYQ